MSISDWSSDVCSSDLHRAEVEIDRHLGDLRGKAVGRIGAALAVGVELCRWRVEGAAAAEHVAARVLLQPGEVDLVHRNAVAHQHAPLFRSEEHTSELQSLMRTSYAVFCLKKKKKQ